MKGCGCSTEKKRVSFALQQMKSKSKAAEPQDSSEPEDATHTEGTGMSIERSITTSRKDAVKINLTAKAKLIGYDKLWNIAITFNFELLHKQFNLTNYSKRK